MDSKIKYFAGIDVQIRRGCAYYILNDDKKYITSGWVKEKHTTLFKDLFIELTSNSLDKIAIGIDAPRMPIKKLRTRYFEREKNEWTEKLKQSNGRECEVLIKSYNIANPQWTRTYKESEEWMKLGYQIFKGLGKFPFVYEVFPSASYKMLESKNVNFDLCLNDFQNGVKDMLDASVAAITVYEFINGRGCEVGGDDGLGRIVLPRDLNINSLNLNG